MSAPMSRSEWINIRTAELMSDDSTVADLFDEIQRHGGLASRAMRAYLLAWWCAPTQQAKDEAADNATNIVGAFAHMRAAREYGIVPLAGEPT